MKIKWERSKFSSETKKEVLFKNYDISKKWIEIANKLSATGNGIHHKKQIIDMLNQAFEWTQQYIKINDCIKCQISLTPTSVKQLNQTLNISVVNIGIYRWILWANPHNIILFNLWPRLCFINLIVDDINFISYIFVFI